MIVGPLRCDDTFCAQCGAMSSVLNKFNKHWLKYWSTPDQAPVLMSKWNDVSQLVMAAGPLWQRGARATRHCTLIAFTKLCQYRRHYGDKVLAGTKFQPPARTQSSTLLAGDIGTSTNYCTRLPQLGLHVLYTSCIFAWMRSAPTPAISCLL